MVPQAGQPLWISYTQVLQAKELWQGTEGRTAQFLRCQICRIWPVLIHLSHRRSEWCTLQTRLIESPSNTAESSHNTQVRAEGSRVMLSYINNEEKRFHVYVANCVCEIDARTKPTQLTEIQQMQHRESYQLKTWEKHSGSLVPSSFGAEKLFCCHPARIPQRLEKMI